MAPSSRFRPCWPRTASRLLLLVAVAASGGVACASGGGTGPSTGSPVTAATGSPSAPAGTGSTDSGLTAAGPGVGKASGQGGGGTGTAPSSNAEVASIELVSTALAGGDASGYLAPGPIDDPALGAPYAPAELTARLAALSGLVKDGPPTVRPSTTAHPASATGPACDTGPGAAATVCDIEVFDGAGRQRATVVVHWAGGGATDVVVVERSDTGVPGGVGQAVCSPGLTLVVGGHAVDRFDVAICADADGAVEYRGANRANNQGITIPACAAGPDEYRATNNGFVYTVKAAGPRRGVLAVVDPSGDTVLDTAFTPYRTASSRPLAPC